MYKFEYDVKSVRDIDVVTSIRRIAWNKGKLVTKGTFLMITGENLSLLNEQVQEFVLSPTEIFL
jgi:hypothetical protein